MKQFIIYVTSMQGLRVEEVEPKEPITEDQLPYLASPQEGEKAIGVLPEGSTIEDLLKLVEDL